MSRHRFDSRIAFAVKTLRYDPLDRHVQPSAFVMIHDSSRLDSSRRGILFRHLSDGGQYGL